MISVKAPSFSSTMLVSLLCTIIVTTALATPSSSSETYKLIQVQIIHRHGDRTPITPLTNEEYWADTLPSTQILDKVAQGTTIKRHESYDKQEEEEKGNGGADEKKTKHAALGIGPFGKLTQLGLFQMVEVGLQLRKELVLEDEEHDDDDDHDSEETKKGITFLNKGRLFTPTNPIHPSKIRVISTDFPRTLQSVQGLLVGFFPDYNNNNDDEKQQQNTSIEIDARHTNSLIPDPQPRWTQEQVDLERELASMPHIKQREGELNELAIKTTRALKHMIADGAYDMAFGIGEENDEEEQEGQDEDIKPLSITQLTEIMKCLKVRNMLPSTIEEDDHHAIASYAAYKWFDSLRNDKLAELAMKRFMNFVMRGLHRGRLSLKEKEEGEPNLHIFSCHDSSLIGLLCAFRLEQPSVWPEYGSYIKIELFERVDSGDNTNIAGSHYVRFSLNGSVLKSVWGLGEDTYSEPADMIPLDHLIASIEREHGHAYDDEL